MGGKDKPPGPPTPRDAASLVLLRDAADGVQVYMVRRHGRSRFMANAHVFPGGRLDEADCAPQLEKRCTGVTGRQAAQRLDLEDEHRARGLYVAALRETFEEAGVLLARPGQGDSAAPDLCDLRGRLNDGETTLAAMLEQHDLVLDLGRLRYLDRWITPEFEPRRYDARFFVGRTPGDQQASHDRVETTAGSWCTVAQLLESNRRGELFLAPPTLCILEGLAGHGSVDAALEAAPDAPMQPTQPRPLQKNARELTLLLPDDHRYDDPDSDAGPVDCVVLREGAFQHLQS